MPAVPKKPDPITTPQKAAHPEQPPLEPGPTELLNSFPPRTDPQQPAPSAVPGGRVGRDKSKDGPSKS